MRTASEESGARCREGRPAGALGLGRVKREND